jgi:hypothetical protein
MTTDVDIANRALQAAQVRDRITALADTSKNAQVVNLSFDSVRRQLIDAANWGFARKTVNLSLLKAAPGAPYSPVTGANQWYEAYPSPPWLYEYLVPTDGLRMRAVLAPPTGLVQGTPIFSTPTGNYNAGYGTSPVRFIRSTDTVGPRAVITGITQADPAVVTATAHGFSNGDEVYLTSLIGMTELNGTVATIANVAANTFELSGVDSSTYSAYIAGGVAVNQTQTVVQTNVILTNAPNAIGVYNLDFENYSLWPDDVIQTFVYALAGVITIPLGGDKKLAQMNISLANSKIMEARANDANEGLTMQQSIPDWIRVRGGYPDGEDNGLGYFSSPYASLFSVS